MPLYDRNIRDANLENTIALPNGAAAVNTADLDLGAASVSHSEVERIDVEVRVPALSTAEAPDTRTLTVDLLQGASASPTTAVAAATVLTGAGGAGIAATVLRFKVHPSAGRYIRARFTGGTSFGNASGKTGAIALLF